jgi:light-regulated signal transduction histidine kinase (bacteriophytochrome)
MESAEQLHATQPAGPQPESDVHVQQGSYFLELSLDWIVLRASENVNRLLGESHVTLIDEPLGRFVHAQALHDLRNLFSRLSGTTGVGRAYAVRLTDAPHRFDIAFQLSDGRVLLEAVRSSGSYGEAFGTVGGLIAGLANSNGQALLNAGARRMRALTGYDRVTLECSDGRAESSRGIFPGPADMTLNLPPILGDRDGAAVGIFPRQTEETSAAGALMHAPDARAAAVLADAGLRATMRVPFGIDGLNGEFRCDSRSAREPSFELHAAAELFAQLFGMRLEIDRLKAR